MTDEFIQLTETVDVDWIQYAIEQFTECEQQIKWTNSPKVFVEIAIADDCKSIFINKKSKLFLLMN